MEGGPSVVDEGSAEGLTEEESAVALGEEVGASTDAARPEEPAESDEVDDRMGLAPFLTDNGLAKEYVEEATAAKRKVNHLVERCLLEACEARAEVLAIDAPGSHPSVFSSRLADEDVPVLVKVLSGAAPFLVRLDLSYNHFGNAGAEQLAQGLLGRRAKRLEILSIRGNSIGPRGCTAICQAMKRCPSLRCFDAGHNPLERAGGLSIVDFMQACPDIEDLRVPDTQIDIDVLVAVAAVLLTDVPLLKVCDLENPRLQTLREEHIVHLGRMLRVNTHLFEIRLGKHRMRDEGVRQLVSFLVENKTLRVLDLRCNELGAEGAQHLGVLLSQDCQLTRLNLDSNRIGDNDNVEGARALADALLRNRRLSRLDLNHNQLCGEALQLLGEAIVQNNTLETVTLFHSKWDQTSSLKFDQIFSDRARILPLKADFITKHVDLRIDICLLQDFDSAT